MSANVFIQTAFLGDLLLSIPLMKKIKALWPDQKLILVCRKGLGEFFAKTGLVDEVFEIKKGDRESYTRVLSALKNLEINKIISPHESVRTAFFVRQIRAQEKVSFQKFWNGFFYGTRLRKNFDLPDAIRQLSLLQNFDESLKANIENYPSQKIAYKKDEAGKLSAPPAWASMSLRGFYDSHKAEAETLFQKLGLSSDVLAKSVALFPGSVWATKRWTEEGYVKLGQKLSEEGVKVLVMGGPGEEELCARVAKQIPGSIDLCAKTKIFESALILANISAVVGNDSASMHLAATSETPSVAIFGPTILQFGFRPWQDKVFIVEKQDLACRPCGKHGHKVCPLGTHACMKEIGRDEVLAKLKGALNAR